CFLVFFAYSGELPCLPPFPTRRSSDLKLIARSLFFRFSNEEIFSPSWRDCFAIARNDVKNARKDVKTLAIDGKQITDGVVLLGRSEEHTSELQSREKIACRLLLEKRKT